MHAFDCIEPFEYIAEVNLGMIVIYDCIDRYWPVLTGIDRYWPLFNWSAVFTVITAGAACVGQPCLRTGTKVPLFDVAPSPERTAPVTRLLNTTRCRGLVYREKWKN